MSRFNIDTDLGIDFADEGPWRSYRLTAGGDSLTELLDSAEVEEIDQDGGTLDFYPIGDAPGEVERASERLINKLVYKGGDK